MPIMINRHRVSTFVKKNLPLFEILLVVIISIPAFISLLRTGYFTMHDDQQIARLFLLDQGIRQGAVYPRWVGFLGFGYGYPLFNFYPPLIYYLAEGFHLLGFSLIWSVKALIITGYLLAAIGIYVLGKGLYNRKAGFLGSAIYTYFFYHTVNVYVRGALAEFFAMTVLPYVFLSLFRLFKKPSLANSLIWAFMLALLILTHPLIAFPAIIYFGVTIIYHLWQTQGTKQKIIFFSRTVVGGLTGLALAAFFWVPSILEKKYTLIDAILTKELAYYQLHFVYPSQFWYSLWGYGGSTAGMQDGMTFQLGKGPILLAVVSLVLSLFIILFKIKKAATEKAVNTLFFVLLLVFSLFMCLPYSSIVWDKIQYLWYLQFPWRFLTFVALFIALVGSSSIYYLELLFPNKAITTGLTIVLVFSMILVYSKYCVPQKYLLVSDQSRTTFPEIAWSISKTSFEFVPKRVKTTKTALGTTTVAINQNQLPKIPYTLLDGDARVQIVKNHFQEKQFIVEAATPVIFRLNTYDFPGWKTDIDPPVVNFNYSLKLDNPYKLITVSLPAGTYTLTFRFEDTLVRLLANYLSLISFLIIMFIILKQTIALSRNL